jgi:hypothetical protein
MLLDVADNIYLEAYIKLNDKFNNLYKYFDEVWLVDATGSHAHHYLDLRRKLENAGAKVGARLFYASRPEVSMPELLRQIPSCINRNNIDEYSYTFHFCTSRQYSHDLIQSLQKDHMDIMTPDMAHDYEKSVLAFKQPGRS